MLNHVFLISGAKSLCFAICSHFLSAWRFSLLYFIILLSFFAHIGISLFHFHFGRMVLWDIEFLTDDFFFSFRTLNISIYYPLAFIVSDKNPAVNLTDVPLDVMNHFSLTAFKKSWKKKREICCGFLCIYLLTYFKYYIMSLYLYWYIDKFYLGFVELLNL